MARLVTCGYELNSVTSGMEPAHVTAGTGLSISSTTKRTGGFALRVNGLSSGTAALSQFIARADASAYLAARIYVYFATFPSAANTFFAITGSGGFEQLWVTVDNSGVLALHTSAGQIGTSSALSLNTWYRLEIEFDNSFAAGSDIGRLYVDGVVAVESTTLSSAALYGTLEVGGNLRTEANTTGDWFIDDIAVNDSSGSQQTALPGAGSVCYLRPDGAGDADTGAPTRGGADSGTMEGQLDEETPNDATDYVILPANPSDVWVDVQAGSVGGIGAGDTITLVEVHGRITAASATASSWFPQIKKESGGSIATGGSVTWGSDAWFTNDDTGGSRQSKLTRYTDPDGGIWTPTTIDSMQISARTEDGNPDTWVSTLWATVEYVPAEVVTGTRFLLSPM